MIIVSEYRFPNNYEVIVANSLLSAPGLNQKLNNEANRIMATAKSILNTAPQNNATDAKNVNAVKSEMRILPVEVFTRGGRAPARNPKANSSKIPVVLVVSNAWQSKWYEFGKGSGNHFPALHFMRKAAAAANARYSKFKPRGRSKRAA